MSRYLKKTTHAAPLAIFRIVTGCMLFLSLARFWANGWIEELYIKPKYFFGFYGFEYIKPLGNYTYIIFMVCAVAAILVAIGLWYRAAIFALFLSFTYIELMDKSTYLNHYYFTSLVLFLLMFLPAHRYFSVDAYRNKSLNVEFIPQWNLDVIKFLVLILYLYAGLAKLNSDWLLNALPLKIWLPARNDMPMIGWLFNYKVTAYIFVWIGCIYDLSIGFLLWNRRTRLISYLSVIIFHFLTAILFPIGMFPYIMMVTALIFFSAQFHQNIINLLNRWLKLPAEFVQNQQTFRYTPFGLKFRIAVLSIFFFFQMIIPFRYMLYPQELFWAEEGYRFSWRVMLMEKAGYAQFTVKGENGKAIVVNNRDFLTVLQEKMMSTQPDFILQYAHLLRDYYHENGYPNPQVFADVYVSLNGRLGQTFVNPQIDLAKEKESFTPKNWILPLNDEIKGF
ncbi:MAG: HTTM domain-containing protein [Bacteroidetes bacterium]|nr:HTTM domain-containing protein [Bacteroidota bacterium]MBU1373964.1 HTTM domain-containing protein [Bacteroidota bacterium]MBU1485308.1 HTTM domain-containing protein [Bacteroidota bacterium]MBU1761293.1 HTTM domain-containing protein [Bacteroidota bacterium]MBU2375358.1 HTTM domain-containing protein [Bacteroidota bacterium]